MTLYPRLTLVHDHSQSDGMSGTMRYPIKVVAVIEPSLLKCDSFSSLLLTPAKHGRRELIRRELVSRKRTVAAARAGPCGAAPSLRAW
jgi:hypothetical protein